MDSCNTGDHAAGDHIHTGITTGNTGKAQQKYHLGTVSKRLLGGGGGGLKNRYFLYCTFTFLLFIYYYLFADMAACDSFARIILLRRIVP